MRREIFDPTKPQGWLLIDKPADITSSGVVYKLRKLLNTRRIGHAGTLDPIATGMLPIAVGEGLKTVQYLMAQEKEYVITVKWGEQTTTDDRAGDSVETTPERPTKEAIEAALPAFIGEIQQTPPIYSAIQIDGKRAYKMARAGEIPEMKPRPILIHDFKLLGVDSPDIARFYVRSGKGAYMRALTRDLAEMLGTKGHIHELRRLSVGKFKEKDMIPLDLLENIVHNGAPLTPMLGIEAGLDGIPVLTLSEHEAQRLRFGQRLPIDSDLASGTLVQVWSAKILIAMAELDDGILRPRKIFNHDTA
ncbi:MAG: tRNA pseudouridine(55) synthase TruB [Alphaproteobacteria bacterium]